MRNPLEINSDHDLDTNYLQYFYGEIELLTTCKNTDLIYLMCYCE